MNRECRLWILAAALGLAPAAVGAEDFTGSKNWEQAGPKVESLKNDFARLRESAEKAIAAPPQTPLILERTWWSLRVAARALAQARDAGVAAAEAETAGAELKALHEALAGPWEEGRVAQLEKRLTAAESAARGFLQAVPAGRADKVREKAAWLAGSLAASRGELPKDKASYQRMQTLVECYALERVVSKNQRGLPDSAAKVVDTMKSRLSRGMLSRITGITTPWSDGKRIVRNFWMTKLGVSPAGLQCRLALEETPFPQNGDNTRTLWERDQTFALDVPFTWDDVLDPGGAEYFRVKVTFSRGARDACHLSLFEARFFFKLPPD